MVLVVAKALPYDDGDEYEVYYRIILVVPFIYTFSSSMDIVSCVSHHQTILNFEVLLFMLKFRLAFAFGGVVLAMEAKNN